ncbi:MAG: DMT family transporter [Planctomycetales bacterium]|nr:DMT family transporter [Planctomycetales bacterium]
MYLLLPLCSSVLVVFGLTFLKEAQERGASAWTATIAMCWASAVIFPLLVLMGGTMQPLSMLWQPAVIGGLFVAGQLFTLLAVKYGDVSIAAPVQGVKVLLVPVAMILVLGVMPSGAVWIAAVIAMFGIACVQTSDATVHRGKVLTSVLLAFLGSVSMTIFDLLIQSWAPAWQAGYFLPLSFAFAALLATVLLCPWMDSPKAILGNRHWHVPLLLGSALMALQAIGMTFTLAQFGDATRVNIVYSLRGIWGVAITWLLLSRRAKRAEIPYVGPSHRVMRMRLTGAVLIGVSVVLAITAGK